MGSRIAVTDLNGDGRLDLVLGSTPESSLSTTGIGHGPLRYYIRQADGSFQLAPSAMTAGLLVTNFSAIAAADFNHDGKGDVAIAGGGQDPYSPDMEPTSVSPGEHSYVLMSGSGANHANVSIQGMPTLFAHDMAVGDVNGDGFDDIYIGSIWGWPSGASYFLMNDGYGGFTVNRSRLPASISNPQMPVLQEATASQPSMADQNIYASWFGWMQDLPV